MRMCSDRRKMSANISSKPLTLIMQKESKLRKITERPLVESNWDRLISILPGLSQVGQALAREHVSVKYRTCLTSMWQRNKKISKRKYNKSGNLLSVICIRSHFLCACQICQSLLLQVSSSVHRGLSSALIQQFKLNLKMMGKLRIYIFIDIHLLLKLLQIQAKRTFKTRFSRKAIQYVGETHF